MKMVDVHEDRVGRGLLVILVKGFDITVEIDGVVKTGQPVPFGLFNGVPVLKQLDDALYTRMHHLYVYPGIPALVISLTDKVYGPQLQAFRFRVFISGRNDHRDVQKLFVFHLPQDTLPVHIRHIQIQEDQG